MHGHGDLVNPRTRPRLVPHAPLQRGVEARARDPLVPGNSRPQCVELCGRVPQDRGVDGGEDAAGQVRARAVGAGGHVRAPLHALAVHAEFARQGLRQVL